MPDKNILDFDGAKKGCGMSLAIQARWEFESLEELKKILEEIENGSRL